jgi:hypothetical protein
MYIPKTFMTRANPPGRPTRDGATNLHRHQVLLDRTSYAFLRAFGQGNLSQGIRALAKAGMRIAQQP